MNNMKSEGICDVQITNVYDGEASPPQSLRIRNILPSYSIFPRISTVLVRSIPADLLLTSALSPVHSLYHHLFCSLIVNVAGRADCPSVWDLKPKYYIYVTVLLSHAYDRRGLPSCPPYQGPY